MDLRTFALVAENRLMANDREAADDDVPRFSEQFLDQDTDVRLWEAEYKDETESRLGPHLH